MRGRKTWLFAAALVLATTATAQRASAQINRASGSNWKVESSTNGIGANPYYYNPTPQPENPVYPAPFGVNQHWSYNLPLYYVWVPGTANTNATITARYDLWVTYYAPAIGFTSGPHYVPSGQTAAVAGWDWTLGGQLIVGMVEATGPNVGQQSYVEIN